MTDEPMQQVNEGAQATPSGAPSEPGPAPGEALARARATLGMSVADVAQQLKFAPRQIEALEAGRLAELPGGTFTRGMVRAYARMLKLDAEPLVERIVPSGATPDNTAAVAAMRRPIPITDGSRRTNLVYGVLSLVILVVVAVVALEWQQERSRATRLTFAPAAREAQVAPRTEVASAVMPQIVPLEVAQAKPEQANPEQAQAAAMGKRRIVMRFEREAWVEVRGRDGRMLLAQLNPAGTAQTVEGEPPFAVVIGNASHVRLSYDDKPVDLVPHTRVEVARLTLE